MELVPKQQIGLSRTPPHFFGQTWVSLFELLLSPKWIFFKNTTSVLQMGYFPEMANFITCKYELLPYKVVIYIKNDS